LNRDRNPPLEEIEKAIGWDRWNADYWYKLAKALKKKRDTRYRIQDKREYQIEIVKALEGAVRLNPFKAEYHMQLGWEYTWVWRLASYNKKWLYMADISMDRAAYFAGDKSPTLHVHLGNYWVIRSKTINPANPEWETAWTKVCWHYKKAQGLDRRKGLSAKIARFVWEYYPHKEFIRKVMIEDN